jgi:hypothetical protein
MAPEYDMDAMVDDMLLNLKNARSEKTHAP